MSIGNSNVRLIADSIQAGTLRNLCGEIRACAFCLDCAAPSEDGSEQAAQAEAYVLMLRQIDFRLGKPGAVCIGFEI